MSLACALAPQMAIAQDWQPNRVPADASAQPMPQASRNDTASRPVMSSNQQLGSGMVLRWQTTAPRGVQPSDQRFANQSSTASTAASGSSQLRSANSYNTTAAYQEASANGGGNPLRGASSNRPSEGNAVRPVAYQQEWNNAPTEAAPQWRSVNTARGQDQGAQDGFPQLQGNIPQGNAPQGNALRGDQLDLNGLRNPAEFGQEAVPNLNVPSLNEPDLNAPQVDPLDKAEAAPQPPRLAPGQIPSFPPQVKEEVSPGDQSQRDPSRPNSDDSKKPRKTPDELDDLLKKAQKYSIPNCDTQRDQLRGQPLASLDLNVAPKLSDGLRGLDDEAESQELRGEFEKRALRRDWTDYKGNLLLSGRMKELRYGTVVVDVDGTERLLPLTSLSDVDMDYIADIWNLPFRCGSGFEPLEGRNFIASTVQWKASGACHNPLYFEQVQLERYGHEAGPIVQPLISSAQFFLTIPILPYKMGINPPNECQYALGYYRPGNCAPYMIPPFPWSLRGGLMQAGAVLGTAAALP